MSPSVFVSIYKYWTWIGILVMLGAVTALVFLILGVIATVKKAHLFKVPLSERQEVEFLEAERVVLSMEGPRFSTRFKHVKFELKGINGDPVRGRPALFRARTSGISTARMELLKFDIPRAGKYILTTTGVGAAREGDARHAVVFMRPHLARALVYVVGIVLASVTFIVSLVFFLLRLRETGPVA